MQMGGGMPGMGGGEEAGGGGNPFEEYEEDEDENPYAGYEDTDEDESEKARLTDIFVKAFDDFMDNEQKQEIGGK